MKRTQCGIVTVPVYCGHAAYWQCLDRVVSSCHAIRKWESKHRLILKQHLHFHKGSILQPEQEVDFALWLSADCSDHPPSSHVQPNYLWIPPKKMAQTRSVFTSKQESSRDPLASIFLQKLVFFLSFAGQSCPPFVPLHVGIVSAQTICHSVLVVQGLLQDRCYQMNRHLLLTVMALGQDIKRSSINSVSSGPGSSITSDYRLWSWLYRFIYSSVLFDT